MPCLRANSRTFGDLRKSYADNISQTNVWLREACPPRTKTKNRIRVCVIPSTSPRQIRTCSRYDDWSGIRRSLVVSRKSLAAKILYLLTTNDKRHTTTDWISVGTARLQVHTRLPLRCWDCNKSNTMQHSNKVSSEQTASRWNLTAQPIVCVPKQRETEISPPLLYFIYASFWQCLQRFTRFWQNISLRNFCSSLQKLPPCPQIYK